MRARAAVLIFAAWPCFIHAQIIHSPREITSNSTVNKEGNPPLVVPCVKNLGLMKCVSAYSVWKTETALSNSINNHQSPFSWRSFVNTSDEDLYSKLCDGTEKLLQRRPLLMNLNGEYSLELGTQNGLFHLDIIKDKEISTGRGTMKKIYKMMKHIIPLLVVPGLIMSAILPFFLPTLKLMTIAAGMLNQMALTGAVFTLMRNNAFGDTSHKTKIVYFNQGYLNDKYEPLADTHSEVFADPHFDTKFNSHELKDYNFFDNNEASSFQSDDWMKPAGQINLNNVKILEDINKFNWGKDFSNMNDFKMSSFKKRKDKEG